MENKKALIALALVAIVGVVGATFAYYTSTATVENEFTTGTYGTTVTEVFTSPDDWTPGTTTEKVVNVTNTGNVPIAIRVKYTEKWTAADGTTVLSGESDGERVAQFETGSSWIKATDGYYYYNTNLTQNQTTSNFIESVTFNPNFELEEGRDIQCTEEKTDSEITINCESLTTGYAGATYTLAITVETIQADQAWTYTVVDGSVPEEESNLVIEIFNFPEGWKAGDTYYPELAFTNTENEAVVVRAKFTDKITAVDGGELPNVDSSSNGYGWIFTAEPYSDLMGGKWTYNDGYYYYNANCTDDVCTAGSVVPNETTEKLFYHIYISDQFVASGDYIGANYAVEVQFETVPATEAWTW